MILDVTALEAEGKTNKIWMREPSSIDKVVQNCLEVYPLIKVYLKIKEVHK